MADLTVLCPTRGRPQNAARLREAWLDTAATAQLILLIDEDDPCYEEYTTLGVPYWSTPRRLRLGPTLNAGAYWTKALDATAVGFLGDDHVPRTLYWDAAVLQAVQDGALFVYGNDLLQGPRLPTACFFRSDVVRALRYMVPGGLEHLYIDDAWKALGNATGRMTYLPDVVIEHMHPVAGKAPSDAGYLEANSAEQYNADQLRYLGWLQHSLAADVAKLSALG